MSDATSGNARRTPRPSTARAAAAATATAGQRVDMVTPADSAMFQQYSTKNGRCDTAVESGGESISGRMHMLNSINTAFHNVSAKRTDSKPYRISDVLPRNWEGSNEKEEFRSFMSDLHRDVSGVVFHSNMERKTMTMEHASRSGNATDCRPHCSGRLSGACCCRGTVSVTNRTS